MKIEKLQCVTSAPAVYDWGWTKTLIDNLYTNQKGDPMRLVEVEDQYHFECQIGRYHSGNYQAITDEKSIESHLEYGWIIPTNNPVYYYRKEWDMPHILDWSDELLNEFREFVDSVPRNCLKTLKGGLGYSLEVTNKTLFDELCAKFDAYQERK